MLLQNAKDLLPRSKKTTLYMCLAATLICLLYAGLTVTRGFPPTEGWYSYYAWLINEKGAVPYLDFELLFPPLYVYIIALFTRIFGYSLLTLRILGAVIYATTGVFACLIFEKLTKKPVFSLLAGIFAVAMLQSEAVQIFYDYIRFMDVAAYGAIYFLLCAVDHIEQERRYRFALDPSLIIGAVLAVAASMFKQSSGLIFLLYVFIFFIFAALVLSHRRRYLVSLGVTLGVTAVLYGSMLLHLASKGAVSAYLHYNFAAATDAKGGSLFAILFGWIGRSWNMLLLGLAGAALIFTALLLCRRLSQKYPADENEQPRHPLTWIGLTLGFFAPLFTLMTLTFAYWRDVWYGSGKMFTAFMVNTLVFAAVAIYFIVARIKKLPIPGEAPTFCFFTGAVFVLSYAVCTSGGLVESQIALGFPLVAMLFLPLFKFRKRQVATAVLAALMLLNTSVGFERKLRYMYSWWGLEIGSLSQQSESVSLPLLRGIRMNEAYAAMYENVAKTVAEHTAPGDEIFAFPHVPILYLLTDRDRATDTAIQWFDVSTDEAVRADIEVLREKKPRVLLICTIDEFVISSHETSFRQGDTSGLRDMQDFLKSFVIEERYACAGKHSLSSGYVMEVWYLP